MSMPSPERERALDEPGSAGPATFRYSLAVAAIILVGAGLVIAFGRIGLPENPQFTTLHATFIFLVDIITSLLLFWQFLFWRRPAYVILAAAFLFSALIAIPFLLTFPGAIRPEAPIIGGAQSSIWAWHLWYTLFPAIIALALLVQAPGAKRLVPRQRVPMIVAAAMGGAVLLVALVTIVVTRLHDRLPVLITEADILVTPAFYRVGAAAAAMTLAALVLALWRARQRAVLHVWLSVVLIAWLADMAASLGAYERYTVGWYFGRILSMFASSALLVVLLAELSRLYARLAEASRELFAANNSMSRLLSERDTLVAELREREEQIRRMAYHDAVTGLPNRRLLMEVLSHTLAQGARYGYSTAVLFLDLDEFKAINDTLGHDAGDALLREVANRLGGCVRAGDTVARLGGDEFVIVLPHIARPGEAEVVARKAVTVIAEPMKIAGHRLGTTLSVGIAICAAGECLSADALIRRADEAMYQAKRAGRNRYRLAGEEESRPLR